MSVGILLLDCSSSLAESLRRQAFDIEVGTTGFCNGLRKLPCQIYERDVIIYNPSCYMTGHIQDASPEFPFSYAEEHLLRGAIFLVFLNSLSSNPSLQKTAFSWVPFMPDIFPTKDRDILRIDFKRTRKDHEIFAPLVYQYELQSPVLYSIKPAHPKPGSYPDENIPLFFNRNGNVLGAVIRRGEGFLAVVPSYESNDRVISTFLDRVVLRLYGTETKGSLTDEVLSPEEIEVYSEIDRLHKERERLEGSIELTRQKLAEAVRRKQQKISADHSAQLILRYHNAALQDEDVALFHLYKIIETLEKGYGSESEAKGKLGCNAEWNLIGKIANASYGNVRHAPNPGEKVKQWSQQDIKDCFEAAEKIIKAYLETLLSEEVAKL